MRSNTQHSKSAIDEVPPQETPEDSSKPSRPILSEIPAKVPLSPRQEGC